LLKIGQTLVQIEKQKWSKMDQKLVKNCPKFVNFFSKMCCKFCSKFKTSGEDDDDDDEEEDWWLLDQVATSSHLVKICGSKQ
jgi:hypothetical protein